VQFDWEHQGVFRLGVQKRWESTSHQFGPMLAFALGGM